MDQRRSQEQEAGLVQQVMQTGVSRKGFLRLSALGAAAALAPTGFARVASAQSPGRLFYTPDYAEYFHKPWATELGSRWFDYTTYVTPLERFFVRNRYASPAVNLPTWKLKIHGDAVENPMEFTFDDLIQLPTRHAMRYLECFGNARTLNWEQLNYQVQGGNWGFGAISQGEWEYIPIAEILGRVKVKPNAKQLLFWSGLDGPDTGRPMPIEEVTKRADVIGLAIGLNGHPLAPDHGGPVRALVPGWAGAASVKWLTEIKISSKRFWTRMHTKEEAYVGPTYQAEAHAPDDEWRGVTAADVKGIGGTWQNVKSFITVPLVMRKQDPPKDYVLQKGEVPGLAAGPRTMRGYSSSPFGIQRVQYNIDNGGWQDAKLVPPLDLEYSWVRFEFPWDAKPGNHVLMTRATDKQGNTQPDTIPFNGMGILCNVVPRFEVKVG